MDPKNYMRLRARQNQKKDDGYVSGDVGKLNIPDVRTWQAIWLAKRRAQLSKNMGTNDPVAVQSEYARQIGNVYSTPVYRSISDAESDASSQGIPSSVMPHHFNTLRRSVSNDPSQYGSLTRTEVLDGSGRLKSAHQTAYIRDGIPQDVADSTLVHELTHGLNAKPQESAISKIIPADGSYLNDPSEVYSRLMEFRKANKIDPKKIYTLDEVKDMRKNSKDFNLFNRYTDDQILKLLNDVASVQSIDRGKQNA